MHFPIIKVLRAFAIFFTLMLYVPPRVLADKTTPFLLDPGNDAIIPFTAAFNDAFLNTSITWGANTTGNLPGPEIQALNKTFDFSQSDWLGIVVDSFEVNFDIEFGLLASGNQTNTFTYPIKTWDLGEVTIDLEILDVNFYLKVIFELYAQITSPRATKFSNGFNAKLLNPAGFILALDIDIEDQTITAEDFTTPFNFSVTPLFNTSDPAPEFVFEVALRTALSLQVSFGVSPNVELLELDLDMPAYNITAHQLSNVDYHCNAITGKTPADQHYSNLTKITEEITTDASWKRGTVLGGHNSSEPIFGPLDLHNLTSSCMAFSPILQTQITAPMLISDLSSISTLSSGGKSAKHLSNGGAVGITFTVEIFLIAIIAGIYWFLSSRRTKQDGLSEHHAVQKGTIFGFFAGVGLAIVGLFKRKHREQEEGHNEYSAPTWQPEPPTEKDWSYKGPVDTANPAYNSGEMPQFVAPVHYDNATTRDDEFVQPQQYSQASPAPTSYQGFINNVPWEEPRSNRVPSSPTGIFRKGVPGR